MRFLNGFAHSVQGSGGSSAIRREAKQIAVPPGCIWKSV
jgi:hypothetical protein